MQHYFRLSTIFFSSSGYIVDDHYMLGNGRVLDWLLLITVVFSVRILYQGVLQCFCSLSLFLT